MEAPSSAKHGDHRHHDEETTKVEKVWCWVKGVAEKARGIASSAKKLGKDDPRRVIHSVKVGSALSFVSLFYYYQPLYDSFGVSAMWAIMTVVVVFEYTVGATLGKGLNRGLATLVAGALGVGAHHLASLSGQIGEPILLGFFVFLQAAISTFIRFFPKIKARYDYGLLIFILTFSLISVSGFRDDEILEMARRRLSTILIGGSSCVAISILVCPVWAGEDLHNLIALNLEKLGNFLEGFGGEYFDTSAKEDKGSDDKEDDKKGFLQGYKSVLNSKSTEESLANLARWEPGHGRFRFRHPWKQYLKVGALSRQCAYRIEALHAHLLNASQFQASEEVKEQIRESCTKISSETGKAIKELANAVKKMAKPSSADPHIACAQVAAKSLRSLLKTGLWEKNDNVDLLEVIPSVTVVSILLDIVSCAEKIAESVHDFASLLDPNVSPEKSTLTKPDNVDQSPNADHVVVTITSNTGV